jgi:hypothetical protein
MKKSGISIIFVIICVGVLAASYGIGICVREIRFHRARIGNEVTVKTDKASTESIPVTVENERSMTHSDNTPKLANMPTANHIDVKLKENISRSITLMGSDPEDGLLVYRVVETPRHGWLSSVTANIDGANVTYTPKSNYTGPDSFKYKVNNGKMDSDPATVKLSILAADKGTRQ